MARRHRSRLIRLAGRHRLGSSPDVETLIRAGQVLVNGIITRNPNTLVGPDTVVTLLRPKVLRGTIKLRGALEAFDARVAGRICLDVGASAGGFTAALLEAGAARVYAVDAGYGQLVGWLRQDPRVDNLERTNLASLGTSLVPESVEVVCVDLSYLALADAIPQLRGLSLAKNASLIALVKAGFELRSGHLVDDEDSVAKAVEAVRAAAEACGWSVSNILHPVTGRGGSPEVFLYASRPGDGASDA